MKPGRKFVARLSLTALTIALGLAGGVAVASVESPSELISPPIYRPLPVMTAGVTSPVLSLCGTWQFCANPGASFLTGKAVPARACTAIEVPGEWVMQGFTVPKDKPAGYRRTFTLPADWKGTRVILRADAVYSRCTVWVNGAQAGSHLGGFTPFEMDITRLVSPGENWLALSVTNESLADSLASGSQYAVHPLGGITRKIRLFAVPPIHVTMLHVMTDLDAAYRDATVSIQSALRNDAAGMVSAQCTLEILGPWILGKPLRRDVDRPVAVRAETVTLKPGETLDRPFTLRLPVAEPWHTEHPHLYRARLTLAVDGKKIETVERTFGCKKVEVRGNQVLVNGAVQKIFGVCRHEAHPLRGRSLAGDLWRKDVELYRAANVNNLRTSHYCDAEELFDAADELGMFIECEAPFCWAHQTKATDGEIREATVRQIVEMGQFYRSHPCVLFWSLGNESIWNAHFQEAAGSLKALDPTRPQTFENFPVDVLAAPERRIVDILTTHYPGPAGPQKFHDAPKPVNFGEYCHLNAYNRNELSTDPGVRDGWGRLMSRMVDGIRESPGVFGGSIWAAMDDTFFIPPRRGVAGDPVKVVGYGTWGPLDGWRRPKPEYWHVKKAYSPVRVLTRDRAIPTSGGRVTVRVANRYLFTNLKELRTQWQAGPSRGTARPDVAPGATGEFALELPPLGAGQDLALRFYSPLGFLVDESVLGSTPESAPPVVSSGPARIVARPDALSCDLSPTATLRIDRATGLLTHARIGKARFAIGGPYLMLLPLNKDGETQMRGADPVYPMATSPCHNWKPDGPASFDAGKATITGSYDEARGSFRYTIAEGYLEIAYSFTCLREVNPRQTGIVLDLPGGFQSLAWERRGFWSYYPEDHIGRTQGLALAFPANADRCSQVGPRREPSWPWKDDIMPNGSNDFRSTKENIMSASLGALDGSGAVKVVSDGSHYVRAWIDGDRVRLLIANYTNAGAERFFQSHARSEYRPLKKGDRVEGRARICVTGSGWH